MVIAKWSIVILVLVLILTGCATTLDGTYKTTIEDPHGEIWTVISKKDSLVKLEKNGVKLEVNNQGKLGIVESIFGVLILKTDIELSNKERSD